jgi:hypothetical protein
MTISKIFLQKKIIRNEIHEDTKEIAREDENEKNRQRFN